MSKRMLAPSKLTDSTLSDPPASWMPEPDLTDEQNAELAYLQAALYEHMYARKPRRFAHSLSVAKEAGRLARIYGVDPYLAEAAGILHDWDKVLSVDEQLQHARDAHISLGVDEHLVVNLLHGLTAAHDLRARFSELPQGVWQAIARHTTGHVDMTALDMVLFVADGTEASRPALPRIEHTRSLIGKVSLTELYWDAFVAGVIYVLETKRYLYPATLEIYNKYALELAGAQDVLEGN